MAARVKFLNKIRGAWMIGKTAIAITRQTSRIMLFLFSCCGVIINDCITVAPPFPARGTAYIALIRIKYLKALPRTTQNINTGILTLSTPAATVSGSPTIGSQAKKRIGAPHLP